MRNRWLIITIVLVLVFIGCYFGLRKTLLNKAIIYYSAKMEKSFGLHISIQEIGFVGFKTIYIRHIKIINENDTILKADSIVISPKLTSLLAGKKELKELSIYHSQSKIDDAFISNILVRYHHLQNDSTSENTKISYAGIMNSWKNTFFKIVPATSIIRNTIFSFKSDSITTSIFIDNFSYINNEFIGEIILADNKSKSKCFVKGFLDPGNENINLSVNHTNSGRIILPFLGKHWHSYFGFDSIHFSINFAKSGKDFQQINCSTAISNVALQDNRIGPEVVSTKSSSFNFLINIGERYAEIDSSSIIKFNNFSFSPYFRIDKEKDRIIHFAFIKKEFEASELFESLPEGLFGNFNGIKTSGKLRYHLNMIVNLDHPDSILFDSNLENKGFKIEKYGVTDFRLINGTFSHDVYEHEQYIKSILVGPENPDFVAIQDISPYIKYAILTSEDGDFYYHHGFNERAFRESIVTNLKEHRFARGGSTITMQLVKNAFLSRNKTISRKLEETLTVWMIENLHLVSKDRMFEVYLNIIEWGPFVYGIKPAAKFYFNKLPAALTLSESIYLTSIIPRPKAFKYTFVRNGEMSGFYSGYSKLLTSIMIRRNQITSYDSSMLKPFVKLTGEAKKFLASPDSSAREDSLFYLTPNQILLDNNIIN